MLKNKEGNKEIILLYFVFFASIFPTLINNTNIFYGKINQTLLWGWDVISLCIYLAITLFIAYKNKSKINIIHIIPALFLVIMQFFAYSQSDKYKTLYMILPIVYLVHYLYAYVLFPTLKLEKQQIHKFFDVIIYFALILCVYNIIINYKYMLSLDMVGNKYIHISSLFSHRNAFGQFLFISIVVNTLMYEISKKQKYIYFAMFFLINLFFTFSRTSICTVIIFYIILYLTKCKTKKELLQKVIIFISIITLIVILCNNDKIMNMINFYVIRAEDGTSGRENLWKISMEILNGGTIIYGYGLGSTVNLLQDYSLTNTHNSYIEMLITGGIIYLLTMLIFTMNIIKKLRQRWKQGEKSARIFWAALISFTVYMLFEKVLLFGTGYAPTIITLIFISIPMIYNKDN